MTTNVGNQCPKDQNERGRGCQQIPLGLGCFPLTGNPVATGHDAKLGPLRALTVSARALSETARFRVSYCHIMLLWSGVGGQLLSYHVAVVRGWWFMLVVNCAHVL